MILAQLDLTTLTVPVLVGGIVGLFLLWWIFRHFFN